MNNIGTSNESTLHKALKFRYQGQSGSTEALVGSFVCDARTESGELIEVQLSNFGGHFKKKITALAASNKIRIIHPIILTRYIETWDGKGKFLRKRKSTKKGSAWDIFENLIHAYDLPKLKNVSIELVFLDIMEKRIADGTGSWWRKGIRIADKYINTWHHVMVLSKLKDYYRFIPFKVNESFTVRKLAEKAGINVDLSRKCLYVMEKLGLVVRTGRQSNAFTYTIPAAKPARKKA